jgi:hypothetical protein
MRTWRGLFYLTALLSGNGEYCRAQSFEIGGTMTITPRRYSIPPYSLRVWVALSYTNWAVTQVWETKSTNRYVTEVSDDGRWLYKVDHWEPKANAFRLRDYSNCISNSWVSQIFVSGPPAYLMDGESSILYYAFASRSYLGSLTNHLAIPIKFTPEFFEEGARPAPVSINRHKDAFGFPERISFLTYDGKGTNAVLEASKWTSLEGGEVPMTVIVTQYASDGGELCIYRFNGDRLSNRSGLTNFTPRLPATAVISDFRFSHGNAYVPPLVFFSNGWPSITEAKLAPNFKVTQWDWERIQQGKKRRVVRRPEYVWGMRICLLVTIVGGAAIIAISSRRVRPATKFYKQSVKKQNI